MAQYHRSYTVAVLIHVHSVTHRDKPDSWMMFRKTLFFANKGWLLSGVTCRFLLLGTHQRLIATACTSALTHYWPGHHGFDEFIEIYSDYKIPFVCHSTPETITAYKMAKLVAAGMKLINIGVQHGNKAFRRNVLKRRMPNKELTKRFEIASASGAVTSADFIMGFPL